MWRAIKFFSKMGVLFAVGAIASASGTLFRQGGQPFNLSQIKEALSPERVSADVPYSQASYYGESTYYAEAAYEPGTSCGCSPGCGCSCGCGCGCC